MDNRLTAIASLIDGGIGFADVGTDHAYLPIYMAQSNYAGNIIAMDITSAPLNVAKAHAAEYGVDCRIRFLLCDGLEACPKEAVDTIIIAGMGGDTICGILDRAEWCMDARYKLILQPMTKPEILRYWLVNNGFGITKEIIAEDMRRKYQIIEAAFGENTTLNDAQLFCGDIKKANDIRLYLTLIRELKKRFEKAVDGLRKSSVQLNGKVNLYENILRELNMILDNGGNKI